jgi:ribosomal protein S17E
VRAAKGSIGYDTASPKYRKYTTEQRVDNTIKATIGLSAMVTLGILTEPDENGESPLQITANGTGDYRKNYQLKETGWQPYSIKIGDKWYSYQYTPLFLALAPIGFYRDSERYNPEKFDSETYLETLRYTTLKLMTTFSDMTFLSSAANLMEAITSTSPGAAENYFARLIEGTGKSLLVPNIYTQAAKEVEKFYDEPVKETKGLIPSILKDVPVARDMYYNKLNALGEPVLPNTDILMSDEKNNPIWSYLTKSNAFVSVPKKNQASLQVWDVNNEKYREMTDNEYYDFIELRGSIIKKGVTRLMSKISPSNEEDKQEIKAEVEKIVSAATKTAKEKIIGYYVNEKKELERINKKISQIKKTPEDKKEENINKLRASILESYGTNYINPTEIKDSILYSRIKELQDKDTIPKGIINIDEVDNMAVLNIIDYAKELEAWQKDKNLWLKYNPGGVFPIKRPKK